MIRALLVDDEEPARERLRRLLQAHEDVEVVDEAADGEQAMDRIHELRPDLLLLDIQMPGCSGLEVAASLPDPRPHIIFCTAFDQHAVDAFELHAVDYLLKPVNRARLAHALDHVRRSSPAEHEASIEKVGRDAQPGPMRFLARRGSKFHVVPSGDVVCFTSRDGLTKLETDERHFWMQPALSELERRLDPARFHRISRATIVNLDSVREVVPSSGGYGEVVMSNGTTLEISRRRFKTLIERLAGS